MFFKKNLLSFLFCFSFILLFAIKSHAQEVSDDLVEITTTTKKVHVGKITKITSDSIYLTHLNETVVPILRSTIKYIKEYKTNSDVKFKYGSAETLHTIWTKDSRKHVGEIAKITADTLYLRVSDSEIFPIERTEIKKVAPIIESNVTRNQYINQPFILPTAFPAGKGNHYYRTYYGIFHDLNFGVTDHLDFSIGTEIVNVIAGENPFLFFGTKFNLHQSDQVSFSLAGKYLLLHDNNALIFSLPITFGNERSNFTISPIGYFSDGESHITGSFSTNLRLGGIVALVSDLVVADREVVGTIMTNFLFGNGISLNVGVIGVSNFEGLVPNIALTIPLRKWQP